MTIATKTQRRSLSALRKEFAQVSAALSEQSPELFEEYTRLQKAIAAYEVGRDDSPYAGFKSARDAILLAIDLLGGGRISKESIFDELYSGGLPRARAQDGKNGIMTSLSSMCRLGILASDERRGASSEVWIAKHTK